MSGSVESATSRPVFRELMDAIGRPTSSNESEVEWVVGDPIHDTRLALGATISDIVASVGLLAADLWEMQNGRRQTVRVDERRASAVLNSFAYLSGAPAESGVKDLLAGLANQANLATFFPARNGRFVHLHGGFPKLHAGTIRLLGCADTQDSVTTAVASWDAFELEEALAKAGMCGAVARTADEWKRHPQGRALSSMPVLEVIKVGDSDPEPLNSGARPLSGIRCLDLTRVLAGPTCARTLAEQGAEVLQIGSANVPNIGLFVLDTAPGKRSAFLDLRQADQIGTLKKLVQGCDVFSQGYRLDVMRGFGLTVEALTELRPGLIYTSINCFGHTGVWKDRPGWEQLAQTVSGMAVEQGGVVPALVPAAATDYATGYLAALGSLVALKRRATEGGSYHVRVSLSQTAMLFLRQSRIDPQVRPLTEAERKKFTIKSEVKLGELTHLAPIVEMSETSAAWAHGPVEVGSDEPIWLDSRNV